MAFTCTAFLCLETEEDASMRTDGRLLKVLLLSPSAGWCRKFAKWMWTTMVLLQGGAA
jgi:hypothetical protein